MTKILVHLHLFYTDQWPEFKECLENMSPIAYDLCVTMNNKDPVQKEILNFKPDTDIKIVKNNGFDIAPFVELINRTDLETYDYIIKLHSKKDTATGMHVNFYNVSGPLWRHYLLSFIKTKESFFKCLDAFKINPKLGMVGNYRLIKKHEEADICTKVESLKMIKEAGLPTDDFAYVAGSMFMARASLFNALKQMNLKTVDFEPADKSGRITFAHIVERLLGAVIVAQRHDIHDPFSPQNEVRKMRMLYIIHRMRFFIYRKKVTRKGKTIIKICKIPLSLPNFKKEKISKS